MVQTIEKSMKSIKLFSIFAVALILTSCSSGGSDAQGGLNLSGEWAGTVSFVGGPNSRNGLVDTGVYSVRLSAAQDRVISPGTDTASINLIFTIQNADGCAFILNVVGATVVK